MLFCLVTYSYDLVMNFDVNSKRHLGGKKPN
jgi:hypothetical protein